MKKLSYERPDHVPSRVYCSGCAAYRRTGTWMVHGMNVPNPPWNLHGYHCPDCGHTNSLQYEWDDGKPLPHCGDAACVGKCFDPECLPAEDPAKKPPKKVRRLERRLIIYSVAITIYSVAATVFAILQGG